MEFFHEGFGILLGFFQDLGFSGGFHILAKIHFFQWFLVKSKEEGKESVVVTRSFWQKRVKI